MNNFLFPIQAIVIHADARSIPLQDKSIHCVVTSPPYWGLRDYGHGDQLGAEKTPEEYVDNLLQVFREVHRVLRDDGTLWLNLGDCYAGTWTSNHAQAVPSINTKDGRYQVRGGYVPKGLKPKDLVGIPWRIAFALQADGWYLRNDIIWHKTNGHPENVEDRCTRTHEYIFLLSKSRRYYFDHDAIREPHKQASIERYQRADTAEKPGWKEAHHGHPPKGLIRQSQADTSRSANKRSVWTVATNSARDAHFATFPPKLIEPCILAGAPMGGIVYDPFGGSGTTAKTALNLGRRAIISDIGYHDIAIRKICE